jgi:hypothetical protein
VSELRVEPIVAALLAKGFFEAKKRDHRYFFFHYKGEEDLGVHQDQPRSIDGR